MYLSKFSLLAIDISVVSSLRFLHIEPLYLLVNCMPKSKIARL